MPSDRSSESTRGSKTDCRCAQRAACRNTRESARTLRDAASHTPAIRQKERAQWRGPRPDPPTHRAVHEFLARSPAPPPVVFFALFALRATSRHALGRLADLFFHVAWLRERRVPITSDRDALVAIKP